MKFLISLIGTVLAVVCVVLQSSSAYAAPTAESCFAFNAGTRTITNYYYNQGNVGANPACPRAVEIPSTIGGVPVTTIGAASGNVYTNSATSFAHKSLTSVIIPNSVTTIGTNAFMVNAISSLTLGNSLTTISTKAFDESGLSGPVVIPNSVTTIGQQAFQNNMIPSLTLGNSVATIGQQAFNDNLLTTVTIPHSVTVISRQAFDRNNLTSVIIQDAATIIGDYAFDQNQIESLDLGNAVTAIGNNSFQHNQLTALVIPDSVQSIGSEAFFANVLTSLDLGSSVTALGNNSFQYNQLTSVIIPNSVTSIGYSAFNTNNLTAVVIEDAATTIDSHAFSDNQIESLDLGSSVTTIGGSAFSRNNLTSFIVPDSVTSIGSYAFYGNELTYLRLGSGLTDIPGGAFSFNHITSVVIPNIITSIHDAAFMGQNPYGEDIDYSTNPDYDLWSNDPAIVQAAHDVIWYVELYTADPQNPNNLKDGVTNEAWYQGDDYNQNGTMEDSLGGHLINPASVTLQFRTSQGVQLRPSETFAGKSSSGAILRNYFASKGPAIPSLEYLPDYSDYTPESIQAREDALSVYYRIGDTFTYSAPFVNGIAPTPVSYSFILGAAINDNTINNVVFTYAVGPGGTLAETGAPVLPAAIGAVSAVLLGGGMLYRQKTPRRRTIRR